ncbi:MAG: sigma 54-interacting transcriptional regulator [Pseudomonadota bacterium]
MSARGFKQTRDDAAEAYLLCFDRGSSLRVPLPGDGRITIGGGDGVDVRIPGCGDDDERAVMVLAGGEAMLEGAGAAGARSLRVSGEPIVGARRLVSGDTIHLGETELIFHGPLHHRVRGTILDLDGFRERLIEETERTNRTRRNLAVVVIEVGDAGAVAADEVARLLLGGMRKIDILGRLGVSEWGAILPETDEQAIIPAERLLHALARSAPGTRAGLARCPEDGTDADPLLTGARHAARSAAPGRVLSVSAAAARISVGPLTMVAVDPAMRGLLELVGRLAPTSLPVLITGETGVGKEVIAQALHHWSDRRSGPLVTVNCAAVAPSLFESELFGHVRGAFTGAAEAKPGLLEVAEHGTILLDEIGECPLEVQAKLLRVLDTHRVCRVGSVTETLVDIRILAATNRDLEEEVERGTFRRDLFYRLNAAVVTIPPLRRRPLDIPLLAQLLMEEVCVLAGRPTLSIAADAMRRLVLHDWPGNVRELRNVVEFCTATLRGSCLDSADLPARVAGATAPWLGREHSTEPQPGPATDPFEQRRFQNVRDELRDLERTRMVQALEATDGTQNRAAELIGMPLRTFAARMREYRIPSRQRCAPARSDP